MEIDRRVKVFLEDCPASPVPHILAGKGSEYLKNQAQLTVSVYLTKLCNLRCRTCYFNAGEPFEKELKSQDWIKIVKKLADIGVKRVYILGGEPTVLPRGFLLSFLNEVKEYGLNASLSTNGILINEELADELKKLRVEQVQVSIDGSTEEVNDYIRGKGSYNAATKAVKVLRDKGLEVSTSMTLTSVNYYQADEFIKLSESLGASVATIIVAQEFGRIEKSLVPTREQVMEAYRKIISYEPRISVVLNGFRFYMPDLIETGKIALRLGLEGYSTCPAGKSRFVIDPRGNIYGCELLMEDEFIEGNVLKDDLKEVWEKGFKAFRKRTVEECLRCPIYDACMGGCPARAYSAKRSIYKKDPLCPL